VRAAMCWIARVRHLVSFSDLNKYVSSCVGAFVSITANVFVWISVLSVLFLLPSIICDVQSHMASARPFLGCKQSGNRN
jgi:hypothetical protein